MYHNGSTYVRSKNWEKSQLQKLSHTDSPSYDLFCLISNLKNIYVSKMEVFIRKL